jgi:acetyl-CoA synthetase
VLEAQKQCPTLTVACIVRQAKEGFHLLDDGVRAAPDTFSRVPTLSTDPLLMYFTSGTTGYPKAVIHDHTYPLAHIITARHWQNVKEGGLHLTVADTGWGKASWGKLYGQWLAGTGVMVYDFDKFVAADLMAVIQKYHVTTFCAPPTIYRFLIKEGIEDYDFSSLTYATNAGEALNYEIYRQFVEKTGVQLMEGFGQTETTLLIANLAGSEARPGSMGKPSPLYDVHLVDRDGAEVAPGEVGEIVVRPCREGRQYGIFSAYNNDDELYKKVWRGGVYHTGDTAYRDEDGYFWYVGRLDDIIKSSGYRIGPFEIESVLMEHPAVLECAITGVPDPERGQVVKATIVLTRKYTASPELAKELQQYVKKATASYKYPRVVEFVEELPKTISGKIRRVEIREKDSAK